jgi:S1-C subfamily serine protease
MTGMRIRRLRDWACGASRSRGAMGLAIASVLLPLSLSSCFFFTDKIAAAFVRIHADDVSGQGIVIDQGGYVVTNAHTIKGRRAISTELKHGERLEFKVLCVNQAKDAAILRIQLGDHPALQPAVLADSDLISQYDEVSISGYATGSAGLATSKGSVVAMPRDDGTSYVQTNAALGPEFTGSAVLNKAGEVVGMVTWNVDQPGHAGYALSSNEIQSLLAQAKEAEANPLAVESVESRP